MGGCFAWLVLLAGSVGVMVSLLRWFEQTADAVDRGWWNRLALLLAFPFAVWFYPSRVGAGRPTPVPRHEPVRGFGGLPKGGGGIEGASNAAPPPDAPPPGTPKEFIGPPKIPNKPAKKKAPVDPEKLARLREKMRQQGMLGDDEGDGSDPPSRPIPPG